VNDRTRAQHTLLVLALGGCVPAAPGVEGETAVDKDAIVGGNNTTITNHPWQISLQSNSGFHFCGGSILDESWILTAAHCVSGSSASSMRVVAGVTRVSQSSSGQVRSVAQILVNPGYSTPSRGHDAALLRLSTPLDLSTTSARPIAIATPADRSAGRTDPGVNATVTGWGTLSSNGSSPDVLQEVTLPIVSESATEQAYGQDITDDQIAGGVLGVGGRDSCQGDSGGPFTVSDGNGGRLLAGIVSWGNGCADARYPGLYSRVSSFASWIQSNVAPNTGNTCTGTRYSAGGLPFSIPDNDNTGIGSDLDIDAAGSVSSLRVSLSIRHTWRGDLRIVLHSPSGTSHVIHDRTGNNAQNLVINDLSLASFAGETVDGVWTLAVQDLAAQDVGTLESWSLTICTGGGGPSGWSGSRQPNLQTRDNATVCDSVTVGQNGDASAVKLDLSGRHDYRAILRATLEHGGVTAEAFPINSFAQGSGSFSLTARAVTGFSGSAAGVWTLCIVDTDAYGDTGALSSWSVHN
jgi:secreted trypsin-like serine protease